MITKEQKDKIIEAVKQARANYPSDSKHAAALGITASAYSNIKKGNLTGQLSDSAWITIARKLNVQLGRVAQWKTVATPTFQYVTAALDFARLNSTGGIFCDEAGIGKTYTAQHYARTHKNTVYVDCSLCKSRQQLVRTIAKEFGVGSTGRYADVFCDLTYYLRSLENPLIILDEAGDLQYNAFLELKALWNGAGENNCGWYMLGAEGLKEKINRSINCKKVGFAEIFNRYGNRYARVTPAESKERTQFLNAQAETVARGNAAEGADIRQLVVKSGGHLRRLFTEIQKTASTMASTRGHAPLLNTNTEAK